jgi:hypothetical protein
LDSNGNNQILATRTWVLEQTPEVDLTGLATEDYVDTAIDNIEIPEVDLTGLATEDYVDTAISNIPAVDLTGLSTEDYVDTAISNIPAVDFTGLATETYVTNNTVASVNGATGVITDIATLGEDGKLSTDQIPSSLAAALVYKGTWNASTNTPTLTNGVGTAGWQYAVDVGGSHNFGAGAISFNPGDSLIYNGTAWEKVPSNTVAAAGTLTGETLNDTVVNSSLTSVGTLTNLTVTNTISGTVTNGVVTTGSYSDPSWLTLTAGKVGLGNVTNESKATMFTNPTLTGTTVAPTPTAGDSSTQIATTAYVQTAGYNSQGVKTVSTGDPTGGVDGDVWYKYV